MWVMQRGSESAAIGREDDCAVLEIVGTTSTSVDGVTQPGPGVTDVGVVCRQSDGPVFRSRAEDTLLSQELVLWDGETFVQLGSCLEGLQEFQGILHVPSPRAV